MELQKNPETLPQTPPRDIDTVTGEILTICRQAQSMALLYAIEIGRRLKEAKSLLPHGEWGNWLRERVAFSSSTAQNFMKIFEEYGAEQISLFGAQVNSQTLAHLPYTKALRLLSLPAEEREEFVAENNVAEMSSRELEKALKERDEANRRAQEAEEKAIAAEQAQAQIDRQKAKISQADAELSKLREQLEKTKSDLTKAREAEKKAKEKVRDLKENPVIAQDVLERIQAEADAKAKAATSAEIEQALTEANQKLEQALADRKTTEQALQAAQERAEALHRQMEMANPDIIEFKTVFREIQQNMARLRELRDKVQAADPDSASKLTAALEKFLTTCHSNGRS